MFLLFPFIPILPSLDSLALETESSGQWNASPSKDRLIDGGSDCDSDRVVIISGFVTKCVRCSVIAPIPARQAAGPHFARTEV